MAGMATSNTSRAMPASYWQLLGASACAAVLTACGPGDLAPEVAKGNAEEILTAVQTAQVMSTEAPSDDFAQSALIAINNARAEGRNCGDDYFPPAPTVLWNDRIAHAALLESQWMQRDNDFGHAWPDGTRVGDRLDMADYKWQHADENIAAGFRTLPAAIQAWIDSPSHCRALMRQDVSETGLAVVPGEPGNTYVAYWTMVLAEPWPDRYESLQ